MATPAVRALQAYLRANTDKKGTPLYDATMNKLKSLVGISDPAGEEAARNAGKPVASFPEYLMGTKGGRFIQGVADPVVGAAQFVANETGIGDETMNSFVQRRNENIDIGREATGSEGFDFSRMGGNVAMGIALTRKIPIPETWGLRALQGGFLGAAAGAATPTDDYEAEKPTQIGIGALTGAIVPAAIDGVRYLGGKTRDLISLVSPVGVEGNARRAVTAAAGDKADEVIRLAAENKNPLGQGSVAEVTSPAGRAELTALLRAAESRNPSRVIAEQNATNATRIEAIRSAGGSAEDLVNAQAFRAGNAAPLYHQAYEQGFDDVATRGLFGEPTVVAASHELDSMLNNEIIGKVMPEVEAIAGSEGIEKGSVAYYHLVKKALDGYLTKNTGAEGLTPAMRSATESVRKQFIAKLGEASPLYNQARQQFAYDSDVINRMNVAQYIENKLIPALQDFGADGNLRGATFAQAMRDAPRTIRSSTGNTIHDSMEEVFANDITALGRINSVGDDLARSANTERLARAGAAKASGIAGDIGNVPQPRILERTMTLANAVLSRMGKKSQEATLDYLEAISRDPVKFAAMMRGASPAERAAITETMKALQIAAPIAATQDAE